MTTFKAPRTGRAVANVVAPGRCAATPAADAKHAGLSRPHPAEGDPPDVAPNQERQGDSVDRQRCLLPASRGKHARQLAWREPEDITRTSSSGLPIRRTLWEPPAS